MAFTTVTVSETFEPDQPGGATPTGYVCFTLSERIHDGSGNEVEPEPIQAPLTAGAISVQLYATDDSTTLPAGAYYTVDFSGLAGASPQPARTFPLPHALTTVNLSALF